MSDHLRIALASGESFSAHRDESLLTAAQRAHWLIRFGCRNGNCEACAATLQRGCVEQRGVRIDAATGPQPVLLCLAHAHTDLVIDVPGDPLHGSPAHARRCYAQLQNIERDGNCWRLTFSLPAGKPLPVYAGQFARIETEPPLDSWIEAGALDGRTLTLFATQPPNLAVGARAHLRYPLGYAYRVAVSARPNWVLCAAPTMLRARRLSAALSAGSPDSVLIDMDGARAWPAAETATIYAYAPDVTALQSWYRQLLDARVSFVELRSDFAILRRWQAWRQDDNGNRFVIADFLDETDARAQVAIFAKKSTARGHQQLYWAEPMSAASPVESDACGEQ